MQAQLHLTDIHPEPSEFKLARTGKTYHLRPLSYGDQIWITDQHYDAAKINKIFTEFVMHDICRIALHLMEPADQADFAAKEVTIMNELGDTKKVKMGGIELLFFQICGWGEKMAIVEALGVSFGGRKSVDQAIANAAELQKKHK